MSKPVVVIGDGWAALGAVGFLAQAGTPVQWIAGTGSRMVPVLPSLEAGLDLRGAEVWKKLAESLGVACGDIETGSYLREFRNKTFREAAWAKAPSAEMRESVREEELWELERRLAPLFEARFPMTLAEVETQIRDVLMGDRFKNITRIEGIPVVGFKVEQGTVHAVILGSGEEIECERVIYADRWAYIPQIQGLPKGLPFLRKREPFGILQASFTHETPMALGVQEGFMGALHREAGEENEKHVWGYFSSDGKKSHWTICIAAEEAEDNHAIAKKLRRMKSALDKMFTGEAWLPAGKTEFMQTVVEEQVRFEEAILFAEGKPLLEPAQAPHTEGVVFMTDGYGPSSSLHQVAAQFDLLEALGHGLVLEAETPAPTAEEAPVAG